MLLSLLLAPSATTVLPSCHRFRRCIHSLKIFCLHLVRQQYCHMLPLGIEVASSLAQGGDEDFRFSVRTRCDNGTTCSCFPFSCLHLVRQQYSHLHITSNPNSVRQFMLLSLLLAPSATKTAIVSSIKISCLHLMRLQYCHMLPFGIEVATHWHKEATKGKGSRHSTSVLGKSGVYQKKI